MGKNAFLIGWDIFAINTDISVNITFFPQTFLYIPVCQGIYLYDIFYSQWSKPYTAIHLVFSKFKYKKIHLQH